MSVRKLFDLSGRKAVITGGSRGLGLQIAEALGEMGAECLIAARKADELETAVARLRGQGIKASALTVDLTRPERIREFAVAALDRLGHCDILVNNAGSAWVAPAEEYPLDGWQKLLDLNLTGVFVLTQEIGRRSMIPRRTGRILLVASVSGLRGNPLGTNEMIGYNTTKAGLINFARTLAGEWGEFGITVNAIAPGFFPSKLTRGALAEFGDKICALTPLGRLGDDEDLKGAAVLLCSDASKHITGQVLAIDGGISAV